MGENQKAWMFWGLLGLAFGAGLALALVGADLAYIVRPAIGVMMIAAGLFFMFGRVFEGPDATDVERAFGRSHAGLGIGLILFGASHLVPIGWWSTALILLASIVMVGTRLATRRQTAAPASRPQG